MDLDINLDDFNIDDLGGDSTGWGSYELVNSPEDCLGMIMTMIDDYDYSEESDIDELRALLDDILEYAELGLRLSRDNYLEE